MGSVGVDDASISLPIIDLEPFTRESSKEERIAVGKDLVNSCRKVGFVYLQNYGLPQSLVDNAFRVSRNFYELSTEKKNLAPHSPGYEIHRGYSMPGFEKAAALDDGDGGQDVLDMKESYEIGSEHWPTMPNVWLPPGVYDEFRPFMTDFYWHCWEVKKRVLRALALGLGLEEETFVDYHTGHQNQMRVAHYPPVPAADLESGQIGRIAAHCDFSTITIVFQDDCGGLQVEDPQEKGHYVHVPPRPGTLVMNIGDNMDHWSNGILKSTKHRVTLPPLQDRYTGDNRMTRERYSIIYFSATPYETVIKPLVTDADHPAIYKPHTFLEWATAKIQNVYKV